MRLTAILLLGGLCCGCGLADGGAKTGGITPVDTEKNENANPADIPYAQRLEMPGVKGGTSLLLVKEVPVFGVNFSAEYDCALRSTRWVAYRWDAANSQELVKRKDAWAEDEDVPQGLRVTLAEHEKDDFDRGHLLSSEERLNSREANKQTFLLTNILPQYNKFNGGNYVWANMEKLCRTWREKWVEQSGGCDTMYVVKGGTIDSLEQQLVPTVHGLIVPRYFYMAFLHRSGNDYRAAAFWVEHTDGRNRTAGNNLKRHLVSIDELELRTGIDFFCNLPDYIENQVEAQSDPLEWGFE